MSQAKVDQYKKDKMNRKKNVQKDKVKRAFRRIAVGVVSLALVDGLDILYIMCMILISHSRQQRLITVRSRIISRVWLQQMVNNKWQISPIIS